MVVILKDQFHWPMNMDIQATKIILHRLNKEQASQHDLALLLLYHDFYLAIEAFCCSLVKQSSLQRCKHCIAKMHVLSSHSEQSKPWQAEWLDCSIWPGKTSGQLSWYWPTTVRERTYTHTHTHWPCLQVGKPISKYSKSLAIFSSKTVEHEEKGCSWAASQFVMQVTMNRRWVFNWIIVERFSKYQFHLTKGLEHLVESPFVKSSWHFVYLPTKWPWIPEAPNFRQLEIAPNFFTYISAFCQQVEWVQQHSNKSSSSRATHYPTHCTHIHTLKIQLQHTCTSLWISL